MEQSPVVEGYSSVIQRINAACLKNGLDKTPQLIAVSKTKPKELIIEVYNQGQRHFGENYIQELVTKSNENEILEKCKDIKWHFIGHLQTNKFSKILAVPNLDAFETVDSEKQAGLLNTTWEKGKKDYPLKVMVQVNTSGEEGKNGCEPSQCVQLADFIRRNCSFLRFTGLMTIGKFGYDLSQGPNPDFLCLSKCRDELCEKLSMEKDEVDLSMGMSDDFEHAIELGSTCVRVGSSIFGERYKKAKDETEITEGVSGITVN